MRALLFVAVLCVAGATLAQTVRPAASVRTSDGSRWVNVRVGDDGLALVGCVASTTSCRRTESIRLTDEERARLEARLDALRDMPRCEPPARARFDVEYTLSAPGTRATGWVPESWARPGDGSGEPGGWSDPCRADARLAHFLAATWTLHAGAP